MDKAITKDFKTLDRNLKGLKQDGITLNRAENRQLADNLKKDVPGKPKSFWRKALEVVEEVAPLVLPIIKMLI
jgi:hypothetical protein